MSSNNNEMVYKLVEPTLNKLGFNDNNVIYDDSYCQIAIPDPNDIDDKCVVVEIEIQDCKYVTVSAMISLGEIPAYRLDKLYRLLNEKNREFFGKFTCTKMKTTNALRISMSEAMEKKVSLERNLVEFLLFYKDAIRGRLVETYPEFAKLAN